MDKPSGLWRIAAASGVVFGLLLLFAVLSGGPPPKLGSSSNDVLKYVTDNRDALRASWFFGDGLATVFAGLFFPTLFVSLWGGGGGSRFLAAIGLAGAALTGALVASSSVAFAVLSFDTGGVGGGQLPQALNDARQLSQVLIGLTVVVFTTGYSLAMTRETGARRWIGMLGLLVALIQLVAAFITYASSAPSILGLIGIVLFCLWAIATSAELVVNGPSKAAAG